MRQTARIISTYSADVFGVASALFELGGMVVMHDASGCNSTYSTHDEPRWYDMESMVFISALTEMEAVLGDDEKLISDIVETASELHPKFIAVAGTPIPIMTGFDFAGVASLIEQRTGIPTFGFPTTSMRTYVHGADMALAALAERFVQNGKRSAQPSCNILGLTPLDFSVNGTDHSIAEFVQESGFTVLSRWAMGSDLDEIGGAGSAHVNLVVSASGIGAARVLEHRFGIPYVIGVPFGKRFASVLRERLQEAAKTGKSETVSPSDIWKKRISIIGEGVTSLSIAQMIELTAGIGTRVLCATDCPEGILRASDCMAPDEEDILESLADTEQVIGDPLYRPLIPEPIRFIPLPSEAFSGRIFRKSIPDLVIDGEKYCKEVTEK